LGEISTCIRLIIKTPFLAAIKKKTLNNIVLLGEPGTGKTSLVKSLMGRDFDKSEAVTRGIEETTMDEELGIYLIDIGGQGGREEISQRLKNHNPTAAIFAIDTRRDEFKAKVKEWDSILTDVYPNKAIHKFLAITRCDEHNMNLDNLIFQELGFKKLYKTSSKTGAGIEELRSEIQSAIISPDENEENVFENVSIIVRVMIDKICQLVAKKSNALLEIEWRDLERVIAQALETIGFSIILTPAAKDGGKDIIASCIVEGKDKKFYIEIKHWKENKPGKKIISKFVEVNAIDCTDGGLFLSTSGYTKAVYKKMGEISVQKIKLGAHDKMVSLCKYYVMKKNGVWFSNSPLPEILFEDTLN
jgi:small GTP-binding protein